MRMLKTEPTEGFVHLQLDTLDDLWALRTLLRPGDLATASTFRTAEATGDKLRDTKMEKRPMRLGVRVESVEWHVFDDHLRILGPIETGPQDHGRFHTLILRPGDDVMFHKRGPLQPWHLRILKEAVASTQAPQVLLLAIDDSEAQFALLKSYGVQLLGSLPANIPGKRHDGAAAAKTKFYEETLRSLQLFRPDPAMPFVVVGPGWWREEFLDFVRNKAPRWTENSITEGTSQGGRTGLAEAVKRGVVARVARDHRVAEETRLIEELLARIARGDGTATYGPADVRRAVAAGAAEDILASDVFVRSGGADEILREAETARGRIHVLSTGHDAGERLQQMGGLAALLRFAVA